MPKSSQRLIYCSNLHTGGGVAVASSLLSELSRLPEWAATITVWASSEVTRNLVALDAPVWDFAEFLTRDVYGARAAYSLRPTPIRQYEAVFAVFGPVYEPMVGAAKVVGFAQPWIAYPDNSAYSLLRKGDQLRSRVKYSVQRRLFARADVLIVEHEHIRTALRQQPLFAHKRIEVVANAVDQVILNKDRWKPVVLPPKRSDLRLGVVSRNYLHKNLMILPSVRDALRELYGLDVEFFVTFQESEYAACPPEFRKDVRNVGALDLSQSPSFNVQMDGIVFPTLLECFSATPLEALATRTPLFASDRAFVRDTVAGHGNFFDPMDPQDIASNVAHYFQRPLAERKRELNAAYEYVTQEAASSYERAVRTMQIVEGTR